MAVAASRTTPSDGEERRIRSKTPVLNSWKDIADYLHCGVRTAQRWERDLQLPVYRPRPGKRGPVCAFPAELQIWLRQRRVDHSNGAQVTGNDSAIAISHHLTQLSSELVRRTAENTRLQREYAHRLLNTIEALKARIDRTLRLGKAV
jgi:hypothetical protein